MRLNNGLKDFAEMYFKNHNYVVGEASELLVDLINFTKESQITIKELYDKYGEKSNPQQAYKNINSCVITINNKLKIGILSFQDSTSVNIDLLSELDQKKIAVFDQDEQLIRVYNKPRAGDQELKTYSRELLQNIISNRKPKEEKERYLADNVELLIKLKNWCSQGKRIEDFKEQTKLVEHLRTHIDTLIEKEIAVTEPGNNPNGCLVILKDGSNLDGLRDIVYRVSDFRKEIDFGMIIKINENTLVQSKNLYFFRYKDMKLYLDGVKSSKSMSIAKS